MEHVDDGSQYGCDQPQHLCQVCKTNEATKNCPCCGSDICPDCENEHFRMARMEQKAECEI